MQRRVPRCTSGRGARAGEKDKEPRPQGRAVFALPTVRERAGRELQCLLRLRASLPLLKQGDQVLLSFTAVCQDDGTWHRAMPRCKSKSQLRKYLPLGISHPPQPWGPSLRREEGGLEVSLSPKISPLTCSLNSGAHRRDQAALIPAGLIVSTQNEFTVTSSHPSQAPPIGHISLRFSSCSGGRQLTFLPLKFHPYCQLSLGPVFSPSQGLWAAPKSA